MKTTKIAVTGASGHIGFNICIELLKAGYEVNALVRTTEKQLISPSLTQVRGDLLNISSLEKLMTNCQAVIHTAGIIQLNSKNKETMHQVNVQGTQNIIDVAQKMSIKRLVHFSSVHAYSQKPHHLPVDETRHFIGSNALFYDQTKRDAHQLVVNAASKEMETLVLCPTSVLGPLDLKTSKLGQAIIDICKGKVPAVVRGGFDFVDVRDVAKGAVSALKQGQSGESYILGNEYLTIQEFSNLVLSANGSTKKLRALPLFTAYLGLPFVQSYATLTKRKAIYDKAYIDILLDGNKQILSDKAKKELNYRPRPIHETIIETVNWFKQHHKI